MFTRRAQATASGTETTSPATGVVRAALLTVDVGDETVSRNLLLKFLAVTRRTA